MTSLFKTRQAIMQKPVVMPVPDDDRINQAKKRKAAEVAKRGGRESTILTSDEKLGGKDV